MATFSHEVLREAIGAYVLSQLGDDLLAELKRHLSGCTSCRAEVAELSPLVAPLSALRGAMRRGGVTAPPQHIAGPT